MGMLAKPDDVYTDPAVEQRANGPRVCGLAPRGQR